MSEYQPDNCAALAQAVLANALVPPFKPVILRKNKVTGQTDHIVDRGKLTQLANRAVILTSFAKGRMIGFVADAYELDGDRMRRKVNENADAHREMFDKYYKILKDYEQETKGDAKGGTTPSDICD